MRTSEDIWVVITAILAAMLIASHQLSSDTSFDLTANYLYWICRVLAEAAIFMAVLFAVERYLQKFLPFWALLAIAIAISLVPFALTITALDLIVGLPELGFNGDSVNGKSAPIAFAYELIYLLDNHVVLCSLLILPRLLQTFTQPSASEVVSVGNDVEDLNRQSSMLNEADNPFADSLDPPLEGTLCSIEAQEHYVQITSTEESRMVLYRFSDVVRQLSDTQGMQVHRSHWVAYSAVKTPEVHGQTMKLLLNDGRTVPVSRTFRAAVERRFQ